MRRGVRVLIGIAIVILFAASGYACASGVAQVSSGSTVPDTPAVGTPTSAHAAPLRTPTMEGPLNARSPNMFDAGPFGKLAVNGVLSGFGVWQNNPTSSDQGASADISNGQIFLQKPTGVVQFYLQAGAYNLPALGTPILSTQNTISNFYEALPVAYLKLAPKGSFSFLAGKLSSLIGAEGTFSFENVDIERGLVWNQGNSVNRGVQLDYSKNKFGGSLSWNDGFYSNRWNWLTGSLTYRSSSANSLELVAGGNLGHTGYGTTAAPAYQNNSSIYDAIYAHTAKTWMVEPYFQYTYVPTYPQIEVGHATSTLGESVFGYYKLTGHMFVAGRLEYISSTGNTGNGAANLLYGPGSNAASVTITPTYQNKAFFTRGEVSYVHTGSSTAGDAFGGKSVDASQVRGLVEAGFLF